MAGSPIKHEKRRIVQSAILMALGKDGLTPEAALAPAMSKQIEKANDGDTQAVTFLRDTLDGKPAQQVALTGADDGPLVVKISAEDAKLLGG